MPSGPRRAIGSFALSSAVKTRLRVKKRKPVGASRDSAPMCYPIDDFRIGEHDVVGVDAPVLTDEALACLLAHRWPGNVRELKNALRYALVAADGDPIGPEHLPEDLRAVPAATAAAADGATLATVEVDAVKAALAAARGNVAAAARKLGVARSTIYRMLDRTRR
jgi:transcriptional regulator with PAS, ATPase and Fis domain